MVAAYFPCGLLCGWALARCMQAFRQTAPLRTALLGMSVVLLVLAENQFRHHWSEAVLPDEEFYRTVMKRLPVGAIADFPMGSPQGTMDSQVMAERLAGAAAAGW